MRTAPGLPTLRELVGQAAPVGDDAGLPLLVKGEAFVAKARGIPCLVAGLKKALYAQRLRAVVDSAQDLPRGDGESFGVMMMRLSHTTSWRASRRRRPKEGD